jgi:hypothetical protein
MPIITLISDWGLKDYYTAGVKGHILSMYPEVAIVDITHEVNAFDIKIAAYILKNAYPNFPKGTVHIIGVETTESPEQKHIAFELDGHFFVGTDNGIPALLLDKNTPEKIIELEVMQDTYSFTFSERDLFAKVAVHLAKGLPIEELGSPLNSFFECLPIMPHEENNRITGTVEYIDHYGNITTNISEELFKRYIKGKTFKIKLPLNSQITKISDSYDDVPTAEPVAIINASGYIEIALNKDNFSKLFNYDTGHTIIVEFE